MDFPTEIAITLIAYRRDNLQTGYTMPNALEVSLSLGLVSNALYAHFELCVTNSAP